MDVGEFIWTAELDLASQDAKEVVKVENEKLVIRGHKGDEAAGLAGL